MIDDDLELMNCSTDTKDESKDESAVIGQVSNPEENKFEEKINFEDKVESETAIKPEKEEDEVKEEDEEDRPVTRRQKRGAQELLAEHSIETKKRHISQTACGAQKSASDSYVSSSQHGVTATVTRQSSRSLNSTPKKEQPISVESPRLLRSQRNAAYEWSATQESVIKPAASSTSVTEMLNTSDSSASTKSSQRFAFVTVKLVGNKKIHTCDKCGLEFTVPNSVIRHQEKSCLRVRVINIEQNNGEVVKKRCPICSGVFFNTHRLSIHIYKHHKNLLGSVFKAASSEALRLNEIQLKKLSDRAHAVTVGNACSKEQEEELMDEEEEVGGEEEDAEFEDFYGSETSAHVANETSEEDFLALQLQHKQQQETSSPSK